MKEVLNNNNDDNKVPVVIGGSVIARYSVGCGLQWCISSKYIPPMVAISFLRTGCGELVYWELIKELLSILDFNSISCGCFPVFIMHLRIISVLGFTKVCIAALITAIVCS